MNGTYEPHPEGGFIVQTPAGVPLRTAFDEERLRGMGYSPRPGIDMNATASAPVAPRPNMATDAYTPAPGIEGSSPAERRAFAAWAPPAPSAPAPSAPAPQQAPTDSATAQASRDLYDRANAKAAGTGAAQARVERDPRAAAKTIRGGGEERNDLPDAPAERGPTRQTSYSPARLIRGGDVRAGFSVDKSGVDPRAWQQYERGETDLLEKRKGLASDLQARENVRGEVESAELGYQNAIEGADMIEAERRQRAMEDDYQRRAAAHDAERNAIANLDTKPDKLFNGNDWGQALAAFSVLAGGLFQGLKGGKNPALEALNNIADRSAANKRYEYEKRRGQNDSEFGRLVQLYGSTKAAEAELKDRKRLYLQNFAKKRALDAGRADAADQMGLQFAQWDQERMAGSLDRMRQLSDHVRESWQLTPDRVIGGAPKVNENDVQALARDYEKAGLGSKEGKAGGVHDLLSQLPEGEIPTPESRNIISRAARWVTDTAAGAGAATKAFDTPSERNAAAALARIKNEKLHELSGAAVSPSEMDRLSQGFNELTDRAGVERWVNEADRLVQRQSASVKAGYRPEVVETFEGRQRERQPVQRSSGRRAE